MSWVVLWLSLCFFALPVTAGPKLSGQDQTAFTSDSSPSENNRGKENGTDVSTGWVDPRINGGRFLDVRLPRALFSLCRMAELCSWNTTYLVHSTSSR